MGYNKLIAIAPNNVSYAKTALPNLQSSKAMQYKGTFLIKVQRGDGILSVIAEYSA